MLFDTIIYYLSTRARIFTAALYATAIYHKEMSINSTLHKSIIGHLNRIHAAFKKKVKALLVTDMQGSPIQSR